LEGAYLGHDLRQHAMRQGQRFVYGNFVASVDGRIAIPGGGGHAMGVPKATANPRDWRLFQELAAQADIVISSGRYLRDRAAGNAQEILRVDDPRFSDLRAWREERGLGPQPDIAIVSRSLQFPIPDVLASAGRKVVVFTTAGPDPERVKAIEARLGPVIVAGEKSVRGAKLVEGLVALGYRVIYSAAGPQVLHLLLADRVLDRLYLTHVNRLLGGHPYASIVEGPLFKPAVDLKLNSVYLDPGGAEGLGQLFLSYDCI
jgi:riboflavin biosynthesis pyrimidine reductase